MKYIRQFGIILAVTCIGEILNLLIPLPIPGSIYGLVLLFLLLACRVIRLEQVKEAGGFLIEIMPLMFIPAAVGLIASWEQVRGMLVPLCVIVPLSTILVMAVTGKVTDFMIGVAGKAGEREVSGMPGKARGPEEGEMPGASGRSGRTGRLGETGRPGAPERTENRKRGKKDE